MRTSSERYTIVYPIASLNPGSIVGLLFDINLVEDTAIGKKGLLSLAPSAKEIVDRVHCQLREGIRILCRDFFQARPVVMLRDNFLALLGVKIFEIGLRDLDGAVLFGDLVDHRDRRFGLDA